MTLYCAWLDALVPYASGLYLTLSLCACLLVWLSRLPSPPRPS